MFLLLLHGQLVPVLLEHVHDDSEHDDVLGEVQLGPGGRIRRLEQVL